MVKFTEKKLCFDTKTGLYFITNTIHYKAGHKKLEASSVHVSTISHYPNTTSIDVDHRSYQSRDTTATFAFALSLSNTIGRCMELYLYEYQIKLIRSSVYINYLSLLGN